MASVCSCIAHVYICPERTKKLVDESVYWLRRRGGDGGEGNQGAQCAGHLGNEAAKGESEERAKERERTGESFKAFPDKRQLIDKSVAKETNRSEEGGIKT